MAEELPVPLSCADRPHITTLLWGHSRRASPHLPAVARPAVAAWGSSLPGALSSEHTVRTHLRAQAHSG